MKTFILFSALALAACQDRFRYECQDPDNHHKPACQPPACEADGTCTKYLIKGDENV
jgi:hypothetical protein